MGDSVVGQVRTTGTGMRVATAVAASAAVPGVFPPLAISGLNFPCRDRVGGPELLDGGTYDNTGLQAFDHPGYRDLFVVCMNAGGVFTTGAVQGLPVIRDLLRANSLLYRRSTALRTSWIVGQFKSYQVASSRRLDPAEWGRQGVPVGLDGRFTDPLVDPWRSRHPEYRTWQGKDLSYVPSVFDRLDPELCRMLVYRGWWLMGAAFSRYFPNLLPDTLPSPAVDRGLS